MAFNIPEDLLYTRDHEWARVEDNVAAVGITDFAQAQLGDIVYLELPEEGDELKAGDPLGVVESTKAVSEVFAPLSGAIVEVNTPLIDTPEVINEDSFDEGWLVKIELSDPDELKEMMTAAEYKEFCESEAE